MRHPANTTLARLGKEETIWAAAEALRAWIDPTFAVEGIVGL
jgi:hypothetical protein